MSYLFKGVTVLRSIDNLGYLQLLSVLFTNIGLGGHTLITGVLLYTITQSAIAFTATLSFGFAIDLVGQFFGGGVLDRLSPRMTAIFANLTRGFLIIVAGLYTYATNSVIGIVVVSLYMSLIGPIYRASTFSLSLLIVEREVLSRFNALRMGVLQIGQLLGLGLVSVMLTFTSREITFIFVGFWFVLGALMTFLISGVPNRKTETGLGALNPAVTILEWRELFRAFRTAPSIYAHILVSSSGILIPTIVQLCVVPLNKVLNGNSMGLALLDGGYTIGAILASLIFSRFNWMKIGIQFLINTSLLMSAASLYLTGLVDNIFLAAACFFLAAFMVTGASISLDTSLQLRSPKEFLGRIAIFQDACMSLVAVTLVPMIGWVIDTQGILMAMTYGSLVILAYLVFSLVCGARFAFGKNMYEETVHSQQQIS